MQYPTTTAGLDEGADEAMHMLEIEQIIRDLDHVGRWSRYYAARADGSPRGTVFGSARTQRDSPDYAMATQLGAALAASGWLVLTGGGPGIMQAVRDGAGEQNSRAVRIEIDGEEPETALDPSRSITVESFALRKLLLIRGVDAIWAFPGGVGTMDELFEVLVLIDTSRIQPIPLVLVEPEGGTYWTSWLGFVQRELIASKKVSSAILDHVVRVTDVELATSIDLVGVRP